ncbi:glycosyltransferase [bacterium]|nr:glycosyltransferase [bacterium]
MIRISVVIPSRKRTALLERVWFSLIKQDGISAGEYDIIIIADGLDEPELLPFRAPQSVSNWKYERIPHAGPARARNIGAFQSRGQILLFLGDDTIAAPNLLAEHLKFHAQNPAALCVGRIDMPDQYDLSNLDIFLQHGAQFSFPDRGKQLDFWQCYSANLSLPRSLFQSLSGFNERFSEPAWEDIEFGYRASRQYGIYYCPDACVIHDHPSDYNHFVERQKILGKSVCLLLELHPELDSYFKIREYPMRRWLKGILSMGAVVWLGQRLYPMMTKLAYCGLVNYYFRLIRYQFFYRGYRSCQEKKER